MTAEPLVEVKDLSRHYTVSSGWFSRRTIDAVKSVSLEIYPNEILALVGESGSGKTTLGRMIVGLVKPSGGTIAHWGDRSNGAAIIFQNPYQSLNPRLRVGTALAEALKVSRVVPKSEIRQEVDRLLEAVQLPLSYAAKYPIALSGGEQQRVAIARALAVRPDFLVADEPTSALDVSVAAQVLNTLLDARRERSFACLFITHDLALATAIADRLMIMKDGSIVDSGSPEGLMSSPGHPYTEELLSTLHAVSADEPSDDDGAALANETKGR